MGQTIEAKRTSTSVPISVHIDRDGGITGLTVVFRLYSSADLTEFLDFADGAFKAAGHGAETQALTEVSRGLYAVDGGFDFTAITIPAGVDTLFVQYDITAGGESGNDVDTIQLIDSLTRSLRGSPTDPTVAP